MAFPTLLSGARRAGGSFAGLTLALFAIAGLAVARAEHGVVPRAALVVGAPAVVAALLVETYLYNELLFHTGAGFRLLSYSFLFVRSSVVAAAVRLLLRLRGRRRRGSDE